MKRVFFPPILAAVLLLCACQPTPDHDAVKQKNTNQLIETVTIAEQNREKTDDAPQPAAQQFPTHFACDFYTDTQNVHVTADVPIRVRTDGTFPMVRVERRDLSISEQYTLMKRLFGTDQLYVWKDLEPTKKQVAESIVVYMEWIENADQHKKDWLKEGGTKDDWEDLYARNVAYLKKLQEKYSAMGDDTEQPLFAVWDGTSYPDDPDELSGVYIVAEPRNTASVDSNAPYEMTYAELPDPNDPHHPYNNALFVRDTSRDPVIEMISDRKQFVPQRIPESDYGILQNGAQITALQAIRKTMAIVDGLGDFTVADVYWTNDADMDGDRRGQVLHWCYRVRLCERYDDAAAIWCGIAPSDFTITDYAPAWPHTCITVDIDRDGTILTFQWVSPQTVTEKIAEDTPLLPFDTVMELFQQQMNRSFAGQLCKDATVVLDDVQLGLMRIREQNAWDRGLMAPVWFFTGVYTPSDSVTKQNPYETEQFRDAENPLLIVNAIDGSIIDPWKGY